MFRYFVVLVNVLFIKEIAGQALPFLGQACNAAQGCGVAFAVCNVVCQCQIGYNQVGAACVAARRANLNEPCAQDTDCATAWSFCKNGKCQCRPKYVQDNWNCRPWRYFCSYGIFNDPLKANGNAVECISYPTQTPQFAEQPERDPPIDGGDGSVIVMKRQVIQPQQPNTNVQVPTTCPRLRVDNCPIGHYCNPVQPLDTVPPGGVIKGVCCAKPKPMCPTGDPISTNPGADCSACPPSHFCFCDQLTNVAACCPRPCPPGNTFVNGQCVPPGGSVAPQKVPCTSDNQCSGGARCVKPNGQPQKTCMCTNGLNYINGICTTALCASGQPLMAANGQMQVCSQAQLCPVNYQCDATFGICCPSQAQTNFCPAGQVYAGATCTQANPACPAGSTCSPANGCCSPGQGK